ncbi:unnamed protein product [Darwinula stevensoni]|uniref:Uncharacterized protein n=1 Tax=Darwinula stevensoni TaxID=69355 RepID=A0A7R8X478_9CRUS|nr:unnamed protein product [Darwinula stevensoni]CAG0885744.1 unnamed protein product [Darwinula stevensoni]
MPQSEARCVEIQKNTHVLMNALMNALIPSLRNVEYPERSACAIEQWFQWCWCHVRLNTAVPQAAWDQYYWFEFGVAMSRCNLEDNVLTEERFREIRDSILNGIEHGAPQWLASSEELEEPVPVTGPLVVRGNKYPYTAKDIQSYIPSIEEARKYGYAEVDFMDRHQAGGHSISMPFYNGFPESNDQKPKKGRGRGFTTSSTTSAFRQTREIFKKQLKEQFGDTHSITAHAQTLNGVTNMDHMVPSYGATVSRSSSSSSTPDVVVEEEEIEDPFPPLQTTVWNASKRGDCHASSKKAAAPDKNVNQYVKHWLKNTK